MTKNLNHALKNIISSILGIKSVKIDYVDYVKDDFFAWNQSMVYKDKFFLPDYNLNNQDKNNLLKKYRPAIDLCCCYVIWHDFDLHQNCLTYSPNTEIHNNFEKIRVIILGSSNYLGFAKNFSKKISENIRYSDNIAILPIFLLDSIFTNFLDEDCKNYLNFLRKNYDKKLILAINNLIKFINDQQQFFIEVSKIINDLQQNSLKEQDLDQQDRFDHDSTKNRAFDDKEDQSQDDNQKKIDDKKYDKKKLFSFDLDDEGGSSKTKLDSGINKDEVKKSESGNQMLLNPVASGIGNINKVEFIDHYKIFTNKYDEVILPQKLVTKDELAKLKTQLDEKAQKLTKISNSAITSFKKRLIAKKDEFLEIGSIEGVINRKKLSQLITDPLVSNILINKKLYQANNVAVTILLDNSGSMRGKPITISALACKTLAQILEQFGIKTEIIGYTTGDWKGGRVKKMWERGGKEPNPGRLNELRHIIYKDFKQSFKRSHQNLALMLKEGLLKENIDGEALIFASKRLERRSENRKIMLVISDGNPIDDATNSANKEDILINHLEMVVKNIEKRSKIEVVAIKIGYSNNNFYKNSVIIKDVSEVGDVMINKVMELI